MDFDLKMFPIFQNVPEEQLEWLSKELEIIQISKGGFLFEKDSPVNDLILILEGDLSCIFKKTTTASLSEDLKSTPYPDCCRSHGPKMLQRSPWQPNLR